MRSFIIKEMLRLKEFYEIDFPKYSRRIDPLRWATQ